MRTVISQISKLRCLSCSKPQASLSEIGTSLDSPQNILSHGRSGKSAGSEILHYILYWITKETRFPPFATWSNWIAIRMINFMIRQILREYLNEGFLEIPRLKSLAADKPLIDISEGQVSYRSDDLPKIHISIGPESSEETSNQFEKLSRSATLSLSVYINRNSEGSYSESLKDQLRIDLEEISQEIEYRIRRNDPVAHVGGLTSFSLIAVEYSTDETTSPVTGIINHSYEIGYFQ